MLGWLLTEIPLFILFCSCCKVCKRCTRRRRVAALPSAPREGLRRGSYTVTGHELGWYQRSRNCKCYRLHVSSATPEEMTLDQMACDCCCPDFCSTLGLCYPISCVCACPMALSRVGSANYYQTNSLTASDSVVWTSKNTFDHMESISATPYEIVREYGAGGARAALRRADGGLGGGPSLWSR